MNKEVQRLLQNAQNQLDYCENCTKPHPAYKGSLLVAIQNCIEAIKLLNQSQLQEHCMVAERLIHAWERCDAYGWRCLYLFRQGEELMLFAYDKDGNEVDPNV
jgi:hypothetical protein